MSEIPTRANDYTNDIPKGWVVLSDYAVLQEGDMFFNSYHKGDFKWEDVGKDFYGNGVHAFRCTIIRQEMIEDVSPDCGLSTEVVRPNMADVTDALTLAKYVINGYGHLPPIKFFNEPIVRLFGDDLDDYNDRV